MPFPTPSVKKGRGPSESGEGRVYSGFTALCEAEQRKRLGSGPKNGREWRQSCEGYWLAGVMGGAWAELYG